MGKFGFFILGFFCGTISFLILATLIATLSSTNSGLQAFEEPGECITTKSLEVFQSLGNGVALAKTVELKHLNMDGELTVLIFNVDEKPYYDKEKIQISKGECARQIGIYKYETRAGIPRTVPAVMITDINIKK